MKKGGTTDYTDYLPQTAIAQKETEKSVKSQYNFKHDYKINYSIYIINMIF